MFVKQIIVTGFQPFGSYEFNPVRESTGHFPGKKMGEYGIVGMVLPCTYVGAFQLLEKAISEINPAAIVSTGLSSSVRGIRFETTGRNLVGSKYPDADGHQPNYMPLVEGGEEFVSANSNNLALANLLDADGIPVEMSANTDSFICDSLLYLTSRHIKMTSLATGNVFIHTPWTDNYRSRVELTPEKITISRKMLHRSIGLIVRNVCDN